MTSSNIPKKSRYIKKGDKLKKFYIDTEDTVWRNNLIVNSEHPFSFIKFSDNTQIMARFIESEDMHIIILDYSYLHGETIDPLYNNINGEVEWYYNVFNIRDEVTVEEVSNNSFIYIDFDYGKIDDTSSIIQASDNIKNTYDYIEFQRDRLRNICISKHIEVDGAENTLSALIDKVESAMTGVPKS